MTVRFLYELYNPANGKRILSQKVQSSRLSVALEQIAKTVMEHDNGDRRVSLKVRYAAINETVVNMKKMGNLTALVALAVEHYRQKAGDLIVESSTAIVEDMMKVLCNPKKRKKLSELELPDLEVGDTLLVGKFKNRKAEIKDFDKDENNQPIAKTTKGDQKIFKPRIAKLMPGAEPPKTEPTDQSAN